MHLTYSRSVSFGPGAFCEIGLSLDINDCTRCPGIMASLAFSQRILFRWLRVDSCNWRVIDLRIYRRICSRRETRYTPGTSGIYLSLILLCKKKKLTFTFFRIKSLRACWIVLQRWAWGRQRGVASSSSLVPFSFPTSAPSRTNRLKILERDLKKKKRKKDRLPRYSEYPKICPIFISSCLVCARACYTPHPSTPTHGKHFFIYFNIFSLLSFRLLLLLATRPLRRDARIIFPCAHAIFLFFFCKFIS